MKNQVLLLAMAAGFAGLAAAPACDRLTVADSFSPDGDSKNDVFTVTFTGDAPEQCLLKIFNVEGKAIFETDNPKTGWNGKKGKENCPAGVYFWNMEYEYASGQKHSCTGNVQLVR